MSHQLSRPDGSIAYDLVGEGPSAPFVLCAPGMGDLRGEYRFLVPRLVAAGYRVATIDLRGHGQSTAAFADYSPRAVGTDLVALIDELRGSEVYVVGVDPESGAAAAFQAGPLPRSFPRVRLLA